VLLLGSFGVAIASALLPFVNIETYLVVLGTKISGSEVLFYALATAAGQTVGKIIWYAVTARSMSSAFVRSRLEGPKTAAAIEEWHEKTAGKPWYAGGLIFVSAFSGFPPLLVMSVVAGAIRMPLVAFIPTTFVGRLLRFYLILIGGDFISQSFHSINGWVGNLL
jgi:membrane protein YqaA with SNARE-associated domain